MPTFLSDRAVLALSGPEARSFLQSLVTNDVMAVTPEQPAYAALLTPQGKILFDFLVHGDADGTLLIDCRKAASETLMKRLSMYKLRAKVEIARRDNLVVALEGPSDPRLAALGPRGILPATGDAADAAYLARRLDLGVPEGEDFGSDRMFAMDAGLDELHAISFTKGCYVGQELTARMKHRGKDRKRLLSISTTDGSDLPAKDTPVTSGDVELGAIISAYGPRGFALTRLDRLAEVSSSLAAGDIPVTLGKPDWLA